MERVFSLEAVVALDGLKKNFGPLETKAGQVEKVLAPGDFIVRAKDGSSMRVRGPENLKVGSKVQVVPPASVEDKKKPLEVLQSSNFGEGGVRLSALLPLGFGGKGASARLEIFVEERAKSTSPKNEPASYFVFTVKTEKQGEIQWSIYLKGKCIALHVFTHPKGGSKDLLRKLTQEIENSLEVKGYILIAPTVFLSRPFKIPEGFRLNLKG